MKEILNRGTVATRNLSELNSAKYNPRVELKPGMPAYESVKKSIQTFGYVDLIVINSNNDVIVGGHQRRTVLMDLGREEEDVLAVDLTPEEEKLLNLALNKTGGSFDTEMLIDAIDSFESGFDLETIGFDELDLAALGSLRDTGIAVTETEESKNLQETLDTVKLVFGPYTIHFTNDQYEKFKGRMWKTAAANKQSVDVTILEALNG